MTDTPLKNKVLASLEAARGGYVSGQSIANRLGVTRAAVWKAVTALRQDGHAISSSPNSGYMLAPQSDKLSVEAIRAALPPKYRTLPIIVFESTGSTNDEARRCSRGRKNAVHRRGQPADARTRPPRPPL
jgi:BirA family biotin operon repressor/biotin-[acetyl-CoA-carboxylase] ligase